MKKRLTFIFRKTVLKQELDYLQIKVLK